VGRKALPRGLQQMRLAGRFGLLELLSLVQTKSGHSLRPSIYFSYRQIARHNPFFKENAI
jgi:hypothetical protein